ncbi:hypothetical protein GDO78_022916 [Eleutherodactylus coqui]|uniref:Uncharacterized protein n=1 Tax=Eleutherodactylus coqui TaxID=57060 RepID=A0A8J6JY85_ELECQ|nr:hypothetical protein GDO78_022916 [Eleutherodactylus coqui]
MVHMKKVSAHTNSDPICRRDVPILDWGPDDALVQFVYHVYYKTQIQKNRRCFIFISCLFSCICEKCMTDGPQMDEKLPSFCRHNSDEFF